MKAIYTKFGDKFGKILPTSKEHLFCFTLIKLATFHPLYNSLEIKYITVSSSNISREIEQFTKHWGRSLQSLSNNDGDGYENVT